MNAHKLGQYKGKSGSERKGNFCGKTVDFFKGF
jgi:hypothetical protein